MAFHTSRQTLQPRLDHAWAMHTMAGDICPDKPGRLYDPHLFDDMIASMDFILAAKLYQDGRDWRPW